MYRSQLLLQQLGIRQWIPKSTTMLRHSHTELWRDQVFEQSVAVPVTKAKSTQSVVQVKTVIEPQSSITIRESVPEQPQSIVPVEVSQQTPVELLTVEEISYPQTISFDYHLVIHEKFVIFAEIADSQQQKLLNNIAAACDAATAQIQWPLAIESWEMNDHVLQGYIQGALALHQVKKMIVLGDFNDQIKGMIEQEVERYASLAELLHSADHKRTLWQRLYPLVYE